MYLFGSSFRLGFKLQHYCNYYMGMKFNYFCNVFKSKVTVSGVIGFYFT